MKKRTQSLVFRLKDFTPETLSVSRLAQYLQELSILLGNEKVYFDKVKKGSACLAFKTENSNEINKKNLSIVTPEREKAKQQINKMLKEDKTTATLKQGRSNIIIFPGTTFDKKETVEIEQEDSIDGYIIKIYKNKKKFCISLQENEQKVYDCLVSKELAKDLARLLFDVPLRLHGTAKWSRLYTGEWSLQSFIVSNYEQLKDEKLSKILNDISDFEGNSWSQKEDPLDFWKKNIRGCE